MEKDEERGIQKGIERGIEQFILSLLSNGRSPEAIHDFCNIPMEDILKIQKETLKHA